jgi:hypothetical protein
MTRKVDADLETARRLPTKIRDIVNGDLSKRLRLDDAAGADEAGGSAARPNERQKARLIAGPSALVIVEG